MHMYFSKIEISLFHFFLFQATDASIFEIRLSGSFRFERKTWFCINNIGRINKILMFCSNNVWRYILKIQIELKTPTHSFIWIVSFQPS